jgi:3D (Asp-Asp-Asp) domain-containing protein
MQPRSMGMALLTASLMMLLSGHRTSVAEQPILPNLPAPPHALAAEIGNLQDAAPVPVPMRPAPAKASATTPAPAVREHRIQPGDTLFALAVRYDTKIEDIVKRNPTVNPDALTVGQTLQVPVNTVKHQKSREELAALASAVVVEQSGKPKDYQHKIASCTLTAYTNSFESTGKRPGDPGYGITASGQAAKEGWTVAVDPELIPLHSIVYIPGVGVRYAEDTGGAVKGRHIDVFYNDDDFARRFGVKHADIYIIADGSGES